jgi:endonuclease YncB( thermonuclease family)
MSVIRPLFRSRWPVALALAAGLLTSLPTWTSVAAVDGPALSGRATVLDGDTIELAGERVRLEGIDAPETGQTCARKTGAAWACGTEATLKLKRLIDRSDVVCRPAGRDKYGRVLGWCSAGGRDLNGEMVRSGHAWAFVRYSTRYVTAEKEARRARAGIWQGEVEPAWVFRERRWGVAEASAPEGCAIKGNITGNGHIYHMPWSPWYGKVRVEPDKGERWFCSEAEAAEAGFRPARG